MTALSFLPIGFWWHLAFKKIMFGSMLMCVVIKGKPAASVSLVLPVYRVCYCTRLIHLSKWFLIPPGWPKDSDRERFAGQNPFPDIGFHH